jgi:hypothetical protein
MTAHGLDLTSQTRAPRGEPVPVACARAAHRAGVPSGGPARAARAPRGAIAAARAIAATSGAAPTPRRTARRAAVLGCLLALLSSCAAPARPNPNAPAQTAALSSSELQLQPWPEAALRFHTNPIWLGADSAYSIDLDATHVLWLFADTFLDPAADGLRTNGPNLFIRNSLAAQSGKDPSAAHDLARDTLTFYWGDQGGAPSSFFPDPEPGAHWYWPLHGARLPDGKLLLFRMLVSKSDSALAFQVDSWDAVAIDDPLQPPDQWQPRALAAPSQRFGKLLGSSVLIDGDYLYAYAVENQGQDHSIFLARWPLAALAGLAAGALDDPEWFTGSGFSAAAGLQPTAAPAALFHDGQVEFSVHRESGRQRYVEIQMQGLFVASADTRLAMRSANHPQGPWSALTPLLRPAEAAAPNAANLAAYAAKAHPEQGGADLILTYVVNDLKQFPPADSVYYPQTLRGTYTQSALP